MYTRIEYTYTRILCSFFFRIMRFCGKNREYQNLMSAIMKLMSKTIMSKTIDLLIGQIDIALT